MPGSPWATSVYWLLVISWEQGALAKCCRSKSDRPAFRFTMSLTLVRQVRRPFVPRSWRLKRVSATTVSPLALKSLRVQVCLPVPIVPKKMIPGRPREDSVLSCQLTVELGQRRCLGYLPKLAWSMGTNMVAQILNYSRKSVRRIILTPH